MKPPPFHYADPTTVAETLSLLAEPTDTAVLAGGQSLVPLLNIRSVTPRRIVDLNRVAGLAGLHETGRGLRIGAMTRQAELEHSALLAARWPLLSEAVRWVAHPQIRSRGTVGGNVVSADPNSELPAALVALDAEFELASVRGGRTLGWREFFVDRGRTALAPDELLVGIDVPEQPARTGAGFAEFSRRHRHRCLAGAAVTLTVDEGGVCRRARIALLGAGPTPCRAEAAESLLTGAMPDEPALVAAAAAATLDVAPLGDVHGTADYRRDLLRTMAHRALTAAARTAATLPAALPVALPVAPTEEALHGQP